jgi:hypothetical protein
MAKRYQRHCIVCCSSIDWFWLPLWYLLAFVLSVLRRFTDSDYPFGIIWPLYCLFFINLPIQWSKDTNGAIRISKSTKNRQYNGQKIPKGQSESVNRGGIDNTSIFWPLYCLFFVDLLILLAPLVSLGHCIFCSWSIYWFLLPLRTDNTMAKGYKEAIRISKSTKNRQYNGQKIPKG